MSSVCGNRVNEQNQVVIIDLLNIHDVLRRPIGADSAECMLTSLSGTLPMSPLPWYILLIFRNALGTVLRPREQCRREVSGSSHCYCSPLNVMISTTKFPPFVWDMLRRMRDRLSTRGRSQCPSQSRSHGSPSSLAKPAKAVASTAPTSSAVTSQKPKTTHGQFASAMQAVW